MNLKNLEVYIFSGGAIEESNRDIYEECYLAWKEVWQLTLLELDGTEKIFSDAFSRQDKLCAIFEENKCISFVGLRAYDFSLRTSREDSIFEAWDEESLKTLLAQGKKVLCCSNLGVRSGYRGEISPGLTLKALNIFLAVQVLLESQCQVMAGTTRADRGVNRAAFSNGAHYIKTSQMHGVEVDLVCFYKEELAKDKSIKNYFARQLWNSRIDLAASEYLVEKKYLKTS